MIIIGIALCSALVGMAVGITIGELLYRDDK